MEYVLKLATFPARIFRQGQAGWFGRAWWHIRDHFIPHARNNYHPHVLADRALGLFSMLLVTVKVASVVILAAGPILPAYSSAITSSNVFNLTNQSREDFFLPALSYNPILEKAAQAKASDMLAKQYFAHNTPDGRTPWNFFKDSGYNYLVAGENLAVDFTDAETEQSAWMNSPGHRTNILNKNFEEIGVGIVQGEFQGHAAIIVAQYFGTAAQQPVAVLNQPTLVAAREPTLSPAPSQKVEPQKSPGQERTPEKNLSPPVAVLPGTSLIPAARAAALDQNSRLQGKQINPPSPPAEPIVIEQADYSVKDNQLLIKVTTQGSVAKVMVQFGELAVLLSPLSDTSWQGSIALSKLAQADTSAIVEAFNIAGQKAHMELANFSPGISENYNLLNTPQSRQIKIFGWQFDPKQLSERFYLFFIAGILTALVLAIGIRRHVQHLNLIANSSFVVILASLLWLGG